MARTDYLTSESALVHLARVTGDLREASRLLADAMVCGQIQAQGRPHLERDTDEPGLLVLRDIGSPPPPLLGEVEGIPSSFWRDAEDYEQSRWDFWQGYASSSDRHPAYQEISLREKDVNALVKFHRERLAGPTALPIKPKERLRDSSWEEWVAALATLAHEHVIVPKLSQTDLLDQIDNRLGRWGLGPKERSTVGPTARKVLERFRNDPPADPMHPAGAKPVKP